jgi:hypothetical protein
MNSAKPVSRRRNLDCMTKKDLQQMAKDRVNSIPHMWKLNKYDLISAMRPKSKSSSAKSNTKK